MSRVVVSPATQGHQGCQLGPARPGTGEGGGALPWALVCTRWGKVGSLDLHCQCVKVAEEAKMVGGSEDARQ